MTLRASPGTGRSPPRPDSIAAPGADLLTSEDEARLRRYSLYRGNQPLHGVADTMESVKRGLRPAGGPSVTGEGSGAVSSSQPSMLTSVMESGSLFEDASEVSAVDEVRPWLVV